MEQKKVKAIPLSEFKGKLVSGLVVANKDLAEGEEIGYVISGTFHYYTAVLKFKRERKPKIEVRT